MELDRRLLLFAPNRVHFGSGRRLPRLRHAAPFDHAVHPRPVPGDPRNWGETIMKVFAFAVATALALSVPAIAQESSYTPGN